MFTKLISALKATRRTIVFTEGPDARILEAADRLIKDDLMDVILIGNVDEVKAAAAKGGFDIAKAEIIDPATYAGMDEMVAKMVELRKGKMSEEDCRAALAKGNYFGTMLVKMGKADALLGGATYSTADTVRPALQLVKTKKGAHLVSSSFILFRKDKDGNDEKYCMGDCAINIDYQDTVDKATGAVTFTAAQKLAEVAVESARTAEFFGIDPKVALLSFSTKGSGKGGTVQLSHDATIEAQKLAPEMAIDGEMQFDAAVSPVVGQLKFPGSKVAGYANTFIFPCIETGNIEVKFENIRIADLFNELSREFAPVAAAKGFLFQIRPVDAMISTDPLLLSRILRNLISNALRYSTKPGSKIVLGARRRPQGKIQIGVYDQGPGIEAADREKIFDAFYRGKSSEGMEEGFGLGLSIVRGLAQRLSIPVSVASRVGKGSVFHLNFVETESTVKAAGNGLPIASGLDIRGSIALLEDNAIVRDAVVLMMKSWGADVVASGEPDDAFMSDVIDRATNGTLSAFISDYNLGSGKPTGLEAIFTVRKASGRKIPCVLLTAVNEDEIRAAYRQLCLNPDNAGQAMPVILQKPATAESLASALRRAVAER